MRESQTKQTIKFFRYLECQQKQNNSYAGCSQNHCDPFAIQRAHMPMGLPNLGFDQRRVDAMEFHDLCFDCSTAMALFHNYFSESWVLRQHCGALRSKHVSQKTNWDDCVGSLDMNWFSSVRAIKVVVLFAIGFSHAQPRTSIILVSTLHIERVGMCL